MRKPISHETKNWPSLITGSPGATTAGTVVTRVTCSAGLEITASVPFRSAPVNACSWTPQATWCLLIVYEGLSDLNLPQKPATNISTVSDDGKVSEVTDEHMSFLK